VSLSEADQKAIAAAVVEHLREQGLVLVASVGARPAGGLVDAAVVAKMLGVRREWVYEHKHELGGRPVGDGPRPRWRFDLDEVTRRYAELQTPAVAPAGDPPSVPATARRRRKANDATGQHLLPIRPVSGTKAA
jgi:hypothetical protein